LRLGLFLKADRLFRTGCDAKTTPDTAFAEYRGNLPIHFNGLHLTSVHACPASDASLLVNGCEIIRSGMIGRFRKPFEIFKHLAAAPAAGADIAHFLGIGRL